MNAAIAILAAAMSLPPFGDVKVVDEIDCAKTDHGFEDYPKGESRVETVLDVPCRVLDVQDGRPSYLAWRLGEEKRLKPNGAYVVVIEYPDDVPRSFFVRNYGNNSRRSFYTGAATGDAYEGPIVHHKPESLKIPQSGQYQRWTSLTFLGEKASNLRDLDKKKADEQGVKYQLDIVKDGFNIAVGQYCRKWNPGSVGVAVSKILLCEIIDEKASWVKLNLPPAPLPRRHVFWREEMSDGVMGKDNLCPGNGGLDWIEQKFRAMKFFGQNTYCKDLLEFGHNQHWDCNWKHGQPGGKSWKWMWGSDAHYANLWTKAVPLAADKYGFDILPYYEYGGAAGDPAVALGPQKRAEPLDMDNKPDRETRGANYTHIWWSEGKLRVDITDPDTLEELKYILEGTILRFREQVDKGAFVGALMRPRPGQWAISFADKTRERFAQEENGGEAVTRDDLKKDKALYGRYIAWYGKRRAKFMDDIRRYLEDNGVKNATTILENDDSETGRPLADVKGMVTDDPTGWEKKLPGKAFADINDQKVVGQHLFLKSLTTPAGTWGKWEWQHASPACDPDHYANLKNVWIAFPFHALFTVTDPECFAAFRNGNGTDTLIRHYDLNEGTLDDGKDNHVLGYAMADWERAGRACMLSEINAMANGDPVNLGYLMGSNYTRGFPEPVREFNRNFLSLPALPSIVVKGACSDPEVILREIDCSKYGVKAKYYALVHVGWKEKRDVAVKIPEANGEIVLPAYGNTLPVKNGVILFKKLKPLQLIAMRLESTD
ncbi:MAG: hypothetical protein IJU44_12190 [Kiritimatiellae bacterium]|nr:hypothetical protein [Kiritimatiellia bacterium]